ncbi:unnamed protein product [Dicrocoelium dendriticum]|nr:unnamed protein product [Dicrocoelium dendriticum]
MELVVASNASKSGIGAAISHVFPGGEEKTIAHAARSLTVAEKNYSQIEKEALAIVFTVKRFRKMLYGGHVKLITNHKSLLSMFGFVYFCFHSKSDTGMAYDFSIQYRSTQQRSDADPLSRFISSHLKENDDCMIAPVKFESEVQRILVDSVRELLVGSDTICAVTAKDKILLQLMGFVQSSWPNVILSTELRPFLHRRGSLSVLDNCLIFGDRVVVPRKLRKRTLQQFHSGHRGTSGMKAPARSFVYWVQRDSEFEQFCQRSETFFQAAKAPSKLFAATLS